jgi:hypothetical protein
LADPRLINYIQASLAKGFSREQLRQTLISVGWNEFVVDDALNQVLQQQTPQQVQPQSPPQQNMAQQTPQTRVNLAKARFTPRANPLTTSPLQNLQQNAQQTNPFVYQEQKKKTPLYIYIIIIVAVLLVLGGIFIVPGIIKNMAVIDLGANNSGNTPENGLNANNNFESTSSDTSSPKDCGTDMSCFIEASGLCRIANLTNMQTTDLLGVNTTTEMHYEIRGLENSRCVLFLKVKNASISLPDGADFIVAAQAEDSANAQIGKTGLCKYNVSDLTAMLIKWNIGAYDPGQVSCAQTQTGSSCSTSGGDFSVAECQGTYFENPLNE